MKITEETTLGQLAIELNRLGASVHAVRHPNRNVGISMTLVTAEAVGHAGGETLAEAIEGALNDLRLALGRRLSDTACKVTP